MRKLWLGAAAVLFVAACRSEDGSNQALGTERVAKPQSDTRQQAGGSTEQKGGAADETKTKTAEVLALIQRLNAAEVELGRLAEQRASSPDVKALGSMLASEHQKAQDRLSKLATDKGLDLQTADRSLVVQAFVDAHKETMSRLRGQTGAQFDAAFLAAVTPSHELLVQLADQGKRISTDADLEGFLKDLSSSAQEHRTHALAILPRSCGGQMVSPGGPAGGAQPGPGGAGTAPGGAGTPPGHRGGAGSPGQSLGTRPGTR